MIQKVSGSGSIGSSIGEDYQCYIDELIRAGQRHNLVGTLNRKEIEDLLIAESRFSWNLAQVQTEYIDVGSGAGLPGIVWAIEARRQGKGVRGILIEPREKRNQFLRYVAAKMNLSVRIHGGRLEDWKQRHEVATCRAVYTPTEVLLRLDSVAEKKIVVSGGAQEPFVPAGWKCTARELWCHEREVADTDTQKEKWVRIFTRAEE